MKRSPSAAAMPAIKAAVPGKPGGALTPAKIPEALTGWIYSHSQTSSVTTAWGVKWDEDSVARDLMQNFYDANRERLDKVVVRADKKVVTITAPEKFNLERLFYLGSEKGDDDIGKYGEGFKAASLCLIRDHAIEPVVISGESAVLIRMADREVEGTDLVPLVYDFFRAKPGGAEAGTRLILDGCGPKLTRAVRESLTHFFHAGNPLVGRELWRSSNGLAALHEATSKTDGAIFYRRLRRGSIAGIPVVIVLDKENSAIEKRTKQDRDRLAFGKELLDAFYKAFATAVGPYNPLPRVALLDRSGDLWQVGHPLIRELAERFQGDLTTAETLRLFGRQSYFAAMPRYDHMDMDSSIKFKIVEDRWRKEGRKELPSYFNRFGVLNANDHARESERKEIARARRAPTPAEVAAVEALKEISHEFAPEILQFFEGYKSGRTSFSRTTYSVALTEEVLGQFKRNRDYRSTEVFIAERVFAAEFPEALATFLHEHAHIFGYDGSREFTDALTQIIETLVRNRASLDRYEKQWEKVRRAVLKERGARKREDEATFDEALAAMTEEELRALVAKVPNAVLRSVMTEKEPEPD